MLRGRVVTRNGVALGGVQITGAGHTEHGSTLSRADGRFDLAVNAGGCLAVNYAKAGYLPAQRQVHTPWQDSALLPQVALIPLDGQVTLITLGSNAPAQVARGSPISDQDGQRQGALREAV